MLLSPSSRRAWIEIGKRFAGAVAALVALLAEGVDRNSFAAFGEPCVGVALLAEGVDRNYKYLNTGTLKGVALLAEGVDRNQVHAEKHKRSWGRPPRGGRG